MDTKDRADINIQFVKGVGPHKARLLANLDIHTVKDALYHLPARYEDRSSVRKIGSLTTIGGELQTIIGKVIGSDVIEIPSRKRLKIFEVVVSDGTGFLKAKWFNQVFLKKIFEVGVGVVMSGVVKPAYKGRGVEMENPEYELLGGDEEDALIHTGRIVPVYPATANLGQKQIRSLLYNIVNQYADEIEDVMPISITRRLNLPPLAESLRQCHFPDKAVSVDDLNFRRTNYHKRLSFEELFFMELGLSAIKKDRERDIGIAFADSGTLIERLRESLPYRLTEAQEKALAEILGDMKSPYPMHRLLQGDVGCGKTVVALMSMLRAVECGYQAVLMAPTEILAEQHYINIHPMAEALGLKTALLTASNKKNRPLKELEDGGVHIAIGTHALLEEGIKFHRLGVAVIDEQHRFGVKQRAVLRKKAHNPDVLVMTATPIPRTLAMTLYGDLDYSVIDSLPPGRTPVLTKLIRESERPGVYKKISFVVKDGGQVYVVYPLIEESEKLDLKSAIAGEEGLKKMFPEFRIALIHGRMKTDERETVMKEFKAGGLDILVSTTVIEVGVDVPNASLMVIVHAERFGLSQLHQLRGRVGRGRRKSEAMLLAYQPIGPDARSRLDVMVRTSNGFEIAEADLEIRGPGEMMGTKQSGLPDLKVANILRDAPLLNTAKIEAMELLDKDPLLASEPALRQRLEGFWKGKIELFKTA